MNMKTLDSLKDMFCQELEKNEAELRQKGINSIDNIRWVNLVTDTIKNIDKICMLEGGCSDDGYSRGGRWEAELNGMYDRDGSYGHRGSRYPDMRYSRNGGYSHGDAKSEMIRHLENMMDSSDSEKSREAIRRCINDLRNN